MNYQLPIILSAYTLDLIIGDPPFRWHPIRLIGKLISLLEPKLNMGKMPRLRGIILVIIVVGISISFVSLSLIIAKSIHQVLYYLLSTAYIYFALSIKDLAISVKKVYTALDCRDIGQARRELAMIVGRNTQDLNEAEIIRASVETTAESAMDGIIAPLFYAFIGGPVLVWTYKAVNTLDSMVGYKSERFIYFGRASATLDSLLNLIPSKITCLLIGLGSMVNLKDYINSFKWGLKYLFKGPEFNGESTEAAMAGALGIKLGGRNFYNSICITRPFIGDGIQALSLRHMKESIRIVYASSFLFILAYLLVKIIN